MVKKSSGSPNLRRGGEPEQNQRTPNVVTQLSAEAGPAGQRKLSPLQRTLLLWLYCEHRDGGWLHDRIHWRSSGSAAAIAARSRALRRLEQRGLVLRVNCSTGVPGTGFVRKIISELHNRTTHVEVLPAGVELAKRLTSEVPANDR